MTLKRKIHENVTNSSFTSQKLYVVFIYYDMIFMETKTKSNQSIRLSASLFAARVASDMMVTCGFTPRLEGTTLPSIM
jgi:hypothetical protein